MKQCANPGCENAIPDSRLRHNSGQKYCSQNCFIAVLTQANRASGFFQQFSKAGNAAQHALKERDGKYPGVRGGARAGAGKRKKA